MDSLNDTINNFKLSQNHIDRITLTEDELKKLPHDVMIKAIKDDYNKIKSNLSQEIDTLENNFTEQKESLIEKLKRVESLISSEEKKI